MRRDILIVFTLIICLTLILILRLLILTLILILNRLIFILYRLRRARETLKSLNIILYKCLLKKIYTLYKSRCENE
jgi:hypothetical protein